MVLAGFVLWLPVLGRIPGIPRPKPVIRFGYLVAQAVVPAFLSFIYIFSPGTALPGLRPFHAAVGLRPLNDQQIAGFVSKLTMLLVLLAVGGVVLARAPDTEDELGPEDPLVWADVERQFERVDRRGHAMVERSRCSPDRGTIRTRPPDGPPDAGTPADGRPGRRPQPGRTGRSPGRIDASRGRPRRVRVRTMGR